MSITQLIRPAKDTFNRLMSVDGLLTGATNANGDYSVISQSFFLAPLHGQIIAVRSIFASIVDSGGITFNGYAGGLALLNGVDLRATISGVSETLRVFKSNADYQGAATNFTFINYNAGATGFRVSFDYEPLGLNSTILLKGNTGDRIEVVLNDNLTFLDIHNFGIVGEVY